MKLKEINQQLNTNYKTIKEFKDKVDWDCISKYQKLSEGFIKEFKDKVYWDYISEYQKLSEGFIKEFKDKVYWYCISTYQKLSEDFIREFKDKVNWYCISKYQKLSEGFIKEFKDKVDWDWISKYQKLSEGFIKEFKDKVYWDYISIFQKLSEGFIKEFKLNINSDNWLYKSAKEKKEAIIKSNLYECYDEHFIAYKAIRSDRYSHYNFQYRYEVGGIYKSHCDCTGNENSFGLSVWTEEEAKDYNNNGLIVKVKIRYEDVGRMVRNNGKIRCFKIEILD